MVAHETRSGEDQLEPGSDRNFGLIVGGILAAVGAYQFFTNSSVSIWLVVMGALLVVLGLTAPRLLHPLNVLWTKLGLLLGRIVTPVIMFLVYIVSIVPIGLLLRLCGKDLLGLNRSKSKSSYWIDRSPAGPTPESLKDQF